jgi:hypothetical protein
MQGHDRHDTVLTCELQENLTDDHRILMLQPNFVERINILGVNLE